MSEALLIFSVARFMEVIHVKLAHERREVIVFEILWQYVLSEGVRVFNDKTVALMVPKHSVLVLFVIYYLVGFNQKVGHLLKSLSLVVLG